MNGGVEAVSKREMDYTDVRSLAFELRELNRETRRVATEIEERLTGSSRAELAEERIKTAPDNSPRGVLPEMAHALRDMLNTSQQILNVLQSVRNRLDDGRDSPSAH